MWAKALLFVTTTLHFATTRAQDLQSCLAWLAEADRNNDLVLGNVEFINFMVGVSPYASACPSLTEINDFLPGGKYYAIFRQGSCYCLDYDVNPTCCDTPTIRLDNFYGEEYLQRFCQDVAATIETHCAPTVAPTANVVQVTSTEAPTVVPTLAPSVADQTTEEDPSVDLPEYTEPDDDETDDEDIVEIYKSWPLWMQIVVPVGSGLFVFLFFLLMFLLCCSSNGKRRKSQMAVKAIRMEEGVDAFPEVLEATDYDETERSLERSLEEGRNMDAPPSPPDKNVSWNVDLPPQTSPQRMSMFLDSLKLEETAVVEPKTKNVPKPKPAKAAAGSATAAKKKKRPSSGERKSRSATSSASAKKKSSKRSESVSSASSAEVFVDTDGSSVESGKAHTSGQVKWRLIPPSVLVPPGAVEVFPLPPVSASFAPPAVDGETKEDEYEGSDDDDIVEASHGSSSGSKRDPDGVRLEDGREYREKWQEQKRVSGRFR